MPVPSHHRSSDAFVLCRPEATTSRNGELAEDNQRLRHQLARPNFIPGIAPRSGPSFSFQ
jgi:hypothetical protein